MTRLSGHMADVDATAPFARCIDHFKGLMIRHRSSVRIS